MSRDLGAAVAQLTLAEKTALLAGADLWSTVGVERLGVPSVRVTDGPNGTRGPSVPAAHGTVTPSPAACVPCGAALGATWDTELVNQVGTMLGQEARTKACRVLLAPTVNLHRSPLGGRNFEAYSEDPLLAGRLAAAFVRGAQAQGVACTVKHFAGNEAETDRMIADTRVDDRTLRELYLLPFELAVREGGAWGIMTSYNRLNGEYCADSTALLSGILRREWGFDGFVVSDWFAMADTGKAIAAGLDLEMPGPGRAYGPALEAAVREGRVDEALVDAAALRLLRVIERTGAAADDPTQQPASVDRPEHRLIARRAATAATVLLRNDGVLPLDASRLRRVAVIGPNAARAVIMGGGSASLTPHYLRTPLDALRDRLGRRVQIVHEPGVDIPLATPEAPASALSSDGLPGMTLQFFAPGDFGGQVIHSERVETGRVIWRPGDTPAEAGETFSWRATANLTVATAGSWLLSMVQTEPVQLFLDGEVVLDGNLEQPVSDHEYTGGVKGEMTFVVELSPDRPVPIELRSTIADPNGVNGAKLGLRPAVGAAGLERAVAAATDADAVIVVVGTDGNWESEGHDRDSMGLPGDQDQLVTRVLEAAPDAVIVLNTGAPVATPWADHTRALLQIWFGGQEMADALADVLVGETEPGGRLPTTIPRHLRDNPSWGNFPPAAGQILYGEGLLIGYRWYESRSIDVSFPFGHGLSYTTFELGPPELSSPTFEPDSTMTVRVPVTNTGDRAGSEVVQLYVAPRTPRVFRPNKELKAFGKVTIEAGASATVELTLDTRSFARWAGPEPDFEDVVARLATRVPWTRRPAGIAARGWVVDRGLYDLHIGRSSADIAHVVTVDVPRGGPIHRSRPS